MASPRAHGTGSSGSADLDEARPVPSPIKSDGGAAMDELGDSKSDGKSLTLTQQLNKQHGNGSRLTTVEAIRGASLQEFVRDNLAKKPFKLDCKAALTFREMQDSQEQVLLIDSMTEFHKFQDRWDDAVDVAEEIFTAVANTSMDIIEHVKGKRRAVERKKKADAELEQKNAIKKIREEAAAQAKAIRKRLEPEAVLVHEIFKVNFAAIKSITPLPMLTELPELQCEAAWSKPFLLSHDSITVWLGDDKVQEFLAKYAGTYQKGMTKAKTAETCGRQQQRIESEVVCKSAAELMEATVCQPLDISSVDGGHQFMEGQWLYGYMPHPDMAYCGFAPNNAALVKIMAVGQVKLLLCELTSLVETSKTKVGPPCENLSYIEGMRNWDAARIEEMVNSGVAMFQGIHDKNQLLFVPQGWIIVEVSMVGSRLIYGYRKAFMQATRKATDEYRAALQLFKTSGRNTTRMDAVIECMTNAEIG